MEIESTNKVIFTENEKAFFEDMKAAVHRNENLTLHVDEMRGLLKSLTGEEIAPAVWMPYSAIEGIANVTKLWGYYDDGKVRTSLVAKDGYTTMVFTEYPDTESYSWDRENQPTHIMCRYNDVKPEPPVKSALES